MNKIYLTEYDPGSSSEGSLDPLGLSSIADRLASKLVPGFRERMSHPRFLTLIAVGSHICKKFDEDLIAVDGLSEPWQVYEWYVVQALVKKYTGTEDIKGLPGSDKTLRSYKNRLPLSATRYLKSPSVFGFHGVYRTLTTNLDIVKDGILGETGDSLLRIWEEEQNINGFYMNNHNSGRRFKDLLFEAVKDGLNKGEVARSWNWYYFNEIAEHLAIYKAGNNEKKFLFEILLRETEGHRKEIINLLIKFKKDNSNKNISEKFFHDYAIKNSTDKLKELLTTIQLYENFARLLTDSFSEVINGYTIVKRPENISMFSDNNITKKASKSISRLYNDVYNKLSLYNESLSFEQNFSEFGFESNNIDFVRKIIEHHFKIQNNKPPSGKLPWLDDWRNDRYMIRQLYANEDIVNNNDEYVHPYRIKPLSSFLKDLNKIDGK